MLNRLVDSYLELRRATGFQMGSSSICFTTSPPLPHNGRRPTSELARPSSGRLRHPPRASAPTAWGRSGCSLGLRAPKMRGTRYLPSASSPLPG
jgi:hypothetical protein